MLRLLAAHQTTHEAVLAVLIDDSTLLARFEAACRAGASEVRKLTGEIRAELKRRKHWYETHDQQHEETVEALYAVAEELLPGTPGAAWGKLRERVEARAGADDPTPSEALEGLLAAELAEWDQWVCDAGHGHARLHVYARTARETLARRGIEYGLDDLVDSAWELARELLPDSPAAGWDHEWSDELHARAVAYLAEHGIRDALTPAEEAAYIELAIRTMLAGDRAGYRRALRGWIQAARESARESG